MPFLTASEGTFPFLEAASLSQYPPDSLESASAGAVGGLDTTAAARRPAAVFLEGSVRDRRTGEALEQVIVEVFVLDEQGEMRRAYAGTALSGHLALPLVREVPHVLLLRKAGYEARAIYLEGSAVDISRTIALVPDHEGRPEELATRGVSPAGIALLPTLALPDSLVASHPTADTVRAFLETPRSGAPEAVIGHFELTQATSLRAAPTHKSEVLLRFRPGDRVKVLEKTEYYWWRVRYEERTGYAKALLLAPAAQR